MENLSNKTLEGLLADATLTYLRRVIGFADWGAGEGFVFPYQADADGTYDGMDAICHDFLEATGGWEGADDPTVDEYLSRAISPLATELLSLRKRVRELEGENARLTEENSALREALEVVKARARFQLLRSHAHARAALREGLPDGDG